MIPTIIKIPIRENVTLHNALHLSIILSLLSDVASIEKISRIRKNKIWGRCESVK